MKKYLLKILMFLLVIILVSCNNNFKITFDTNGGSLINPLQFSENFTLEQLNNLETTKDGYQFKSWHFSNLLDENSKVVEDITKSTTLYAKWEIIEYVITYHLDGGINNTNNPNSYTIIDEVNLFAPTKDDKVFLGWFLDNQFNDYILKIEEGTFNNLNLYAKWSTGLESEVIITWQNENGEILKVDNVIEGQLPIYEGVIPTKEETLTHTFEFIGWSPEITLASSNITYVATYISHLKNVSSFDYNQLNSLFAFDIYSLIPEIITNDYEIVNYSDSEYMEVYIDIYDWDNDLATEYIDNLDLMLNYDEQEDAFIVGNFYLYVFEDDELFDTLLYGIAIYGYIDEIEPSIPSTDEISFNLQNTTSNLSSSYKDTVDQTLAFNNLDNVIVKVSHLADIQTAPQGLNQGLIFASDIKGLSNAKTYLEILTTDYIVSKIIFNIEARDNFNSKLLDAKLQTYNGNNWVDLDGSNFYNEITTNETTITLNNINTNHFRLLFVGSSSSSNGGQFKITNITLNGSNEINYYDEFVDVINDLANKLNIDPLNNILPNIDNIDNLLLNKVSNREYQIEGILLNDNGNIVNNYLNSLETNGFSKDIDLSNLRNEEVYVLNVNSNLAYGIYINLEENHLTINFWYFETNLNNELTSLSIRQSINEYELNKFNKSGLPSKGQFNVLVIPVEIKDSPFPSNYYYNLNLVFNGTSLETGYESVASYYYKSSYGLLDLTFDIAPKVVTNSNKSTYESYGEDGDQRVIVEALRASDNHIDFSQYDYNNDGLIDSVIFIYSTPYDDGDLWWAWVYNAENGYADSLEKLDNKRFEYYFWASYDFINDNLPSKPNALVNAETYIHELGHLMGMPDLYTSTNNLNYGPLGGFDMMDFNSGDHGPFNKLLLGWLEPLLATTGSHQILLDAYTTDNDGLNNTILIPYNVNDLNDGNAFDEYLLIMFYTPKGLYEGHLSESHILNNAGIVIYHIDARLVNRPSFWGSFFINDNDGTNNFLVSILEADKNNSLPSKNTSIKQSDLLTSGYLDLSYYSWHQGGNINVSIEIVSTFNNNSNDILLNLVVS